MDNKSGIASGVAQAGQKTAQSIGIGGRVRPAGMIGGLKRNLNTIREAYKSLVYARQSITKSYEWLFDNYYILEREGRLLIKELSALGALPGEAGASEPAVMRHARSLCEAARGSIDASAIEEYIAGAQRERDFESVELSALSLMLRAALIEDAAKACGPGLPEEERELLLSDAVKTLNFLTTFDFSAIVERQSRIEQILAQDPAGVYLRMDERSRGLYRKRIADIARRRRMPESEAAGMAVELAEKGGTPRERHVGYYILDRELDRPAPDFRGRLYLTLIWAVPAVVAAAAGPLLRMPLLAPLLYLPLWEAARPVIDHFILKGVPATFLPRLELEGQIPDDAPTLVVISALLTSPQKIESYVRKLEQFYYSNGRGNILFGLLADLKESRLPEQPEDRAIRNASAKAIRRLNEKYGSHFCIFIRSRRLNATQGSFSGWERKRGAITELVRLIKGGRTSISTVEGDLSRVRAVKYIITLDSDTGLLMDTAAEMVSVAMHPLNAPEVDREHGVVRGGYGILAPRIGVDLESAGATPFSRVMAGSGGVTAYDNAAGDTYQDLFDEGIFAGKGLIQVDAFYEVLDAALPENRILSHDILEGCLMRAAFLSDVELTDGFPPRPGPWLDRLHRWIRGDWQNLPFIGRRIPAHDGTRPSPLDRLSRFKLWDNLRRSLTPVLSFACVAAAAFVPLAPALTLIIAAFLASAGAGLWGAALAVAAGGPSMLSRKYHCKVLPQAVNAVAQGVLGYLFLPIHTMVALDGIVRALWRSHTGKNLLEWTTAAEVESRSAGGWNGFWRFWPAAVAGIVFLLAAPQPAAKVAGAFFIVTPFVAWLSGRAAPPAGDDLTDDDRETVRSYVAAMWRYYEDYVGAQDHFLPPDNVQEAPVHAVAHRTSPTNIGLMLLACLTVRDLNLIDSEALYERVENTLTTLERLERWNGHLLNWYDTRTLRPLRPAYVSTVDSGNLLCCLTALIEGLRDYTGEAAFGGLCARIQKFVDDADMSVLFNKRRKLFHIGYDVESGKLSDIYYDLLMSEARMSSYYAIARRQAPKRHWGALGRTLTRQNGYTGPVSWTGTMFEYLMPHLLLPVFDDSLAAEALRFVIYCQKRRVKDRGVPWGISESGFYAFDAALNYQYEAHGVQKLALKRGMDNDLVVSPYSTFLALPFDPGAAMKNLRSLEDLGLYGRCGFYEAVDFTLRRTEVHPAVIKSYMAHHVGMSIVSCANALLDGVMQKRFMRNCGMRAAVDLLQEKIPSNAVVFNDVLPRGVPEKPGRGQFVREAFEQTSPVTPRVHTVSNGEYTMVISDTGASFSMFRGIDLIRRSTDLLRDPTGVYAYARFGKTVLSAASAPEYAGSRLVRRSVEFQPGGARYGAMNGEYGIAMHTCLHGHIPCEARNVEIANYTARHVKAELLLYFEPTLAKTADEAAHPAFSRLFLSAAYRPDIKTLVFARRPRGSELPACLAAGFAELDEDFEFELDRTRLLERPEGIPSLAGAFDVPFDGKTGAVPDAAAALRISVALPPHGKKSVTLLMAAANTAEDAAARLIEARREGFHEILRGAAGRNSNGLETRLSALILPQILFPVRDGGDNTPEKQKNRLGQPGLWSLGISGDFPLILFHYSARADLERLEPYIKTHRELRLRGISADLAVTYREGGDYSRAQYEAIRGCVCDSGCDYLLGARGGIHIVNLGTHPDEIRSLLIATACHIAVNGQKAAFEPYTAMTFLPGRPADTPSGSLGHPVYAGGFDADGFVIPHDGSCPPAPWCHILGNFTFGTLLSDRSLGFTWAVNSRENKLTPWSNDPVTDNRGELLALRWGTRCYDLCRNAKVTLRPDLVTYESRIDGLKVTVSVRVPGRLPAKLMEVRIENPMPKPAELEVAYYAEPILGVGTFTKRQVVFTRREDMLLMRNPWAAVSGNGFLTATDGPVRFIQRRASFFSGAWEDEGPYDGPDLCAAAVARRRLLPGEACRVTFALGWAACEEAAVKTAAMLADAQALAAVRRRPVISGDTIRISTPDQALDSLINGCLRWQVLSSRIMGRTGFYQCGGAWGFRDQLQDCCAALLLDPSVARAHIYRCCAHQFREGDVMHWWHQLPPRDGGARGVRTRCSDDMLWLPYTVCEYLEKTGDDSVLAKEIFYLDGPELDRSEDDRYFAPQRSKEKDSVYGHCVRAIERANRLGTHGLPLFGSGDWNDGMNLVGIGGAGESVWLAMFLSLILDRFAPVCARMHDDARARQYPELAEKLRKAVDDGCWDDGFYLRGFYDDGSPLGGRESAECRIDLLPQSFAVIAGMPDEKRRASAIDSAQRELADGRLRIIRLFTPPFDGAGRNPGYIRSYPPGMRENGGQYTHAAVWLALALLRAGRSDEAARYLSWINPVGRTDEREKALQYRLEPYAIAGDISSNTACEARGGWSLYTGAAGWYYRTVIEVLLGIQLRADRMELDPRLPSDWPGFSAEMAIRGTHVQIHVRRAGQRHLTVDGAAAGCVPLDGGTHTAELTL